MKIIFLSQITEKHNCCSCSLTHRICMKQEGEDGVWKRLFEKLKETKGGMTREGVWITVIKVLDTWCAWKAGIQWSSFFPQLLHANKTAVKKCGVWITSRIKILQKYQLRGLSMGAAVANAHTYSASQACLPICFRPLLKCDLLKWTLLTF